MGDRSARIDVYLFLVDPDDPRADLVAEHLSRDERDRAASFLFEEDRQRYTLAHGFLRALLGEHLNVPAASLRFGVTDRGKPFLVGQGRDGLRFNLAHSGPCLAYAVAWGRELGIDVEARLAINAADLVVRSHFSRDEVVEYEGLLPEVRAEAFCAAWTRKEAYLKATGEGLFRRLDSFSVSMAPREQTTAVGSWTLVDLPAPIPRTRVCLAYGGPPVPVTVHRKGPQGAPSLVGSLT